MSVFVLSALVVAGSATLATAGTGPASALGTATATVASVGLDVKILPVLGAGAIDVPLNLTLNQQSAPKDGTDENQTTSVLRVRDGLLNLVPSSQSPNLLDADAASSTVRTTPTYSQAYATVANLRLFLPFVSLPSSYATDGVLRLDAVSAVATCNAGQQPSAQFQLPAEVTLLGKDMRLPADGKLSVTVPLLGSVSLSLGPTTSTSASSASASVAASLDINVLGLAEVSGSITLASASCTSPTGAAPSGTTSSVGGAVGGAPTGTLSGLRSTTGRSSGGSSEIVLPAGGGATSPGASGSVTPDRLESARFASEATPTTAGVGLLEPLLMMAAGSLLTVGCLWLLRRHPGLLPRRHR